MGSQSNVVELKQSLVDFQSQINEMIATDPEYAGEADDVLAAIQRVEKELVSINTDEEFAEQVPHFADDLFFVLRCAQQFADAEDGDEDGEDEDFEDEDDDYEDDEFDFDENQDIGKMLFDQEISKYVNRKSIEMFFESGQFKKLTKPQQEEASHILEAAADYLVEHLHTDFHDLMIEDLEEVCMELFPEDFYSKKAVFKDVPPVLTAFFTFLGDKKLLDEAEEFVQVIEENGAGIVEALSTEEVWTPAKKFLMEMNHSKEFEPEKLKEQAEDFWDQIELNELN